MKDMIRKEILLEIKIYTKCKYSRSRVIIGTRIKRISFRIISFIPFFPHNRKQVLGIRILLINYTMCLFHGMYGELFGFVS